MDSRANLGIAAVNGIRQVKNFVKRFDSDPSRVPLTRELLKAVQRSHKTYSERLRKRKASTVCKPVTEKKIKLGEEKLCLERCLESSKAMLERAQGLIKMRLRHENMDKIESAAAPKDKDLGATSGDKGEDAPGNSWVEVLYKRKENKRDMQAPDIQAQVKTNATSTGEKPKQPKLLRLPSLREFKHKVMIKPRRAPVDLKQFKTQIGEALRSALP
ncbi:hypothetical protein HPB47_008508 [Ixodes persulcatus]|uniref:Uncharacterized protein n=1 Tax=Ixodes persulcatus TaxID=34615 RepID=A0AC60P4T1_IXOPE|nr:hypothetical protein HPB47_008508 [Ixodes persulcatus]